MGKELYIIQMEINLQENIKMVKKMEKEIFITITETNIKETLKII